MMTLSELEVLDKDFLNPSEVSGVIGCDQYSINVQAKEDPSKLGFPVCVMGTRVRIPRVAFIKWVRGIGLFEYSAECSLKTGAAHGTEN